MALVIADRVKETSTTTGTGTFTLGGAVAGYQAFSVIGNGNQCYYTIVGIAVASEWEVGVGTYSSSTITRDIVLSSSTGGAKVSFSAGNKEVFVTYPADRSVSQADVGTAPNEIPINQYLGSLAYQDAANIAGDVGVGGVLTVAGASTFQAGTAALPSITPTGDANTGLFFPAADTIAASTAGSERLRINSAGNVGLGVTPSAWAGSFNTMQLGIGGFIYGRTVTPTQITVGANAFFDSNFKYVGTGQATLYGQSDGAHSWSTAPSGTAGNAITFTQAMTLTAAGNLGIGTTSPSASAILDAQSTTKGVRMPNMTTTQKNAIASPAAGLMVFDTTLSKLSVYSGVAWETITSV
jgi:hypothetical protein